MMILIEAKDREGNPQMFWRRISFELSAYFDLVVDEFPRMGLSLVGCWLVYNDGKRTRLRITIPPERLKGEQISLFDPVV